MSGSGIAPYRRTTCDEMIIDVENYETNWSIAMTYGSELAGNFGMIPCGAPVVWGGKCERHKVERRSGGDRRKAVST